MCRFVVLLIVAIIASSCSNSQVMQRDNTDKLDVVVTEIYVLQQQIRTLNQKLNVMQATLSLPNSILPFRDGNTSNVTHSIVAPFSLAGLPSMGSSLAKIAIVEFTDYQCPFCKQYFGTTYKKVKENFVDQGIARYYIADFPLENHNFAFPAAIAAQCAFGQDMFWEYHDRLFGLERGITSEEVVGQIWTVC